MTKPVAARFYGDPVRGVVRSQENAAYLVRMFGIAHVEAHDGVAALHGLDEIVANHNRNLAHPIPKNHKYAAASERRSRDLASGITRN
jgi:hypothetical protein